MTAPWTPPVLDVPRFTEPALCAQADPDAFVPDRGDPSRAAKLVCRRCPAAAECLAYALDHRLTASFDGIWGGTSPRERRELLKSSGTSRRAVPRCGTTGGYQAHRRHGERTCEACREANRIYQREYQYRSGRRTRPGQEAA